RETTAQRLLAALAALAQGLSVTDVQVSGHDEGTGADRHASTGLFTNTGRTYSLPGSGLVLSTGDVADYGSGPNTSPFQTTAYGTPATPDDNALLTTITGHSAHYDVTRIHVTFDLLPGYDHFQLNAVFGS